MEACNKDYYIIMSITLLDNLSSLRQKVNVICIFLNKIINWKWYVEMEFHANISLGSVQATVMGRLRCRTHVPRCVDGICQYNKSTLILTNLSPRATEPYLFLTQIHHFSLVVYVCTKLALWNGVINDSGAAKYRYHAVCVVIFWVFLRILDVMKLLYCIFTNA